MTSGFSDNTVTVDGMTFTDGPVPAVDEYGCTWVLQNIEGWFGGVSVRGAPVDRPLTDGSFDGPAPFAGRVVTVTGTVIAPDREQLQAAFDRVSSVLSGDVRNGDLEVFERVRSLTRSANVRLDGAILVKRMGPVTAEFSLPFYASDPNRYSGDEHIAVTARYSAGIGRVYSLIFPRSYGNLGSDGFAYCTNAGNRSSWPVFEIAGPSLNPSMTLVETGEKIAVTMQIDLGQKLVIDTRNRSVMLGTFVRRSVLTSDSTWFALPPGDSQVYYKHTSTAPGADSSTLTVRWRDAWS